MKKLFAGILLLSSFSVFADSYLSCWIDIHKADKKIEKIWVVEDLNKTVEENGDVSWHIEKSVISKNKRFEFSIVAVKNNSQDNQDKASVRVVTYDAKKDVRNDVDPDAGTTSFGQFDGRTGYINRDSDGYFGRCEIRE